MKHPGVYLINGFVQFRAVTARLNGMLEQSMVNRTPANEARHAVKIGPVKDGGVPFTLCAFVSELNITAENLAVKQHKGSALLGVWATYEAASGRPTRLRLVNDDGNFVWCMVTRLG